MWTLRQRRLRGRSLHVRHHKRTARLLAAVGIAAIAAAQREALVAERGTSERGTDRSEPQPRFRILAAAWRKRPQDDRPRVPLPAPCDPHEWLAPFRTCRHS